MDVADPVKPGRSPTANDTEAGGAPRSPAAGLTGGSIQAGTKSNAIPDPAELQLTCAPTATQPCVGELLLCPVADPLGCRVPRSMDWCRGLPDRGGADVINAPRASPLLNSNRGSRAVPKEPLIDVALRLSALADDCLK